MVLPAHTDPSGDQPDDVTDAGNLSNDADRSEQVAAAADLRPDSRGLEPKTASNAAVPTKKKDPLGDDLRDKGPVDARGGGKRRKDGSRSRRSPERTCLVTRDKRPPSEMIRFVLSPDGVVTPDVNGKLPGRGVWLTATEGTVREAVRRKVFARGFRAECTTPDDLPAQVGTILQDFTLGALGMGRAAGAVITGFSKVDQMIRTGEAWVVLTARDVAADGKRKIAQASRAVAALGGDPPHIYEAFDADLLTSALARRDEGGQVMHVALKRAQNGRSAVRKMERLARYRGIVPIDVTPGKGANTARTESGP
ncbi:MAG: RNA-binding protein [Pseudomonadota bacterium]